MLNGLEVGLIGFVASLALAGSVFWIWALVNCARRIRRRNGVGWLADCYLSHAGARGVSLRDLRKER
jgi:hypothetical protein